MRWINRGHLQPPVVRDHCWTMELVCPPAAPMGTDLGLPITVSRQPLEPNDRLLLYIDGIIDTRDRAGRRFHHPGSRNDNATTS